MSAGDFGRFKYECDNGDVCPVRLQPETLAATFDGAANAEPAGPINMATFAKVNKTSREYGIRPRYVTGEWDGAPPADYSATGTVKIAVMTRGVWDAILPFSAMAYLGGTVTVTGKTPENIR